MTAMPAPLLLTPEEACDIFGFKGKARIHTLLKEARAGHIPGAKKLSPRRWLFSREAIERWARR